MLELTYEMRIVRSRAFVLVAFLSCLLPACATSPSIPTSPPNTQPPISKETDPDIVVMSGFGTNRASGSILGLKPMTFEELSNCGTKIKSIKEDHARFKAEDSNFARRQVELERQGRAFDIERPSINIKKIISKSTTSTNVLSRTRPRSVNSILTLIG